MTHIMRFRISVVSCKRDLVKLVKPDNRQLAIWYHCTEGLESVTPKHFDTTVSHILKLHGIDEWEFV